MNIAVIGCGYVGLISGLGYSALGHDVVGIETDEARLTSLREGTAPFAEPGIEEALRAAVGQGRIRFAATLEVETTDVILLCVQTPPTASGEVDLAFLRQAAEGVAESIGSAARRRRIVVIRSTVTPGTNAAIAAILGGPNTAVVSNPEFLREGSALADFLQADRIVVGCREDWAAATMRALYEGIDAPVIVTTPETAELAKYASNALLATLVSFSNELGRISEVTAGADADTILSIVHHDRRLTLRGESGLQFAEVVSYLKAGCGFGGSCLPKDVAALAAYARSQGVEATLLQAVQRVNHEQAGHVLDLAEARLGSLGGRTVAVLGAAFKAGTDDVRSSPGLQIAALAARRGAAVRVFDPLVSVERLAIVCSQLDAEVAPSLAAALAGADACIVTTHAPEFGALERLFDGSNCRPLVVDGRRTLAAAAFAEGDYIGIGRWVGT